MPASYAALPDEIISLIADMVHEQDRAFSDLVVARGSRLRSAPLPDPGDGEQGEDEGKDPTSVTEGRWSPSYGRGIGALVQVDRRTRSHAVNHFYKTITAKQAAADFCRYAVLGEEAGTLVHEVDLDLDPDHTIDPSKHVTGLIVDNTALELAYPDEPEPDEARKLLGLSILEALGRLESLDTLSVDEALLARVLGGPCSATLCRLNVDEPVTFMPLGDEFVAAMNGLQSLSELELGDMSPGSWTSMRERVRLDHVQTLTLGRAGAEKSFHEVLVLAHHIAPQARRLCIRYNLLAPLGNPALPDPLLPALRVLDIQHAQHYLPALHEIRLPALEHLHLSFNTCFSIFPYKTDYLPPASTALRTITLSYPSLKRLTPPSALLARCADLSIRLSIHRRLASADALTRSRRGPADAGNGNGTGGTGVVVASRSQALALEETLTWARNRARWLRETDDGPGLQELAEATVRLRERHLVHES